jgi:hypothetical protein
LEKQKIQSIITNKVLLAIRITLFNIGESKSRVYLMTYRQIKVILEKAQESSSQDEFIQKIRESTEFFSGKSKKNREKYIERCIKLGLLDIDYKLTELGSAALRNFDEVLSETIFDKEYNGKKFRDLLLQALSAVNIPIVEQIYEKLQQMQVDIPIPELSFYLDLLAQCGSLQKNRKITYSFAKVEMNDFEAILRQEYLHASKDPTGLIWYEKFKEEIQKKYNLTADRFDALISEVQKKNPRLISLQRSRTKTWFALREV